MLKSLKLLFKFPRTKVITYNIGNIDMADDPSYAYKLEVSRQHQEFHRAALMLLHGSDEYLVVRGISVRALKRFMRKCGVRKDDPLLNEYTIAGPNGVVEHFMPLD